MAAFGAVPKELKIKEKQDKLLKQQLEKERENQLLQEIEKTEKERIRKRGNQYARGLSLIFHINFLILTVNL